MTKREDQRRSERENGDQLFGYYEYIGPADECESRMEVLAEAPRMREWWDML